MSITHYASVIATVGITAAAAMGVATIVSATTASAQITITTLAYCVGSTYSLTVAAADAATLIAQAPNDDQIGITWSPAAGGSATKIGANAYSPGKDVTIEWTPTAAGTVNFQARPVSSTGSWNWTVPAIELLGITVVQGASPGIACGR
ncbi:hypothetical protein AB0N05_14065 [Nocardia sp. NPDC051030]|uniref:hypothetical protein n=1 Tax=Nocardia sp. NPDC051030 TaxID=3155162 RepID=UPI0034347C74